MDERNGVHLLRTEDRGAEVDAFVARAGRRVGLAGVLADLNREARAVRVPARASAWGFRWNRQDQGSRRWWPQGITTAAESGDPEQLEGRSVVVTSAYAQGEDDTSQGARLSVVDVTDRDRIRYRHVLLVEPRFEGGELCVRPVRLHAGGLAWHGDYLHVAGTTQGLSCFRLDDVVALPVTRDPGRFGFSERGLDAFGYRYVLPVRFTYQSGAEDGVQPIRYSFVSVDRSTTPHTLVAGEYGRDTTATRLVRYDIDPDSSLLEGDDDGRSRPRLVAQGVEGMQGATVVDGTWYVTNSRGRYRLGSLWTGPTGHLVEHRHALPVGPEDLTYWPSRDELWSVSEHPGARYVFAVPRSCLAG